jgi:uncharacterized membrane protein
MTIRTFSERVLQTVCFEIGGVLLATPVYAMAFGLGAEGSARVVMAQAVAALLWCSLHNWAFDLAEHHLCGRLASDRPHRLRVVHAISHEVSLMLVTVPILMVVGGHGFFEAVVVDLGFTAFYVVYAYLYHLAYDRLRPVREGSQH